MKTHFEISGKVGKWIQKFLENRKQQVLVKGTKSDDSKFVSGAIQGSVIGAVIFLIFVTDMTQNVEADAKLLIDDAKVKDKIKTEDDVEKLQDDLDKLYQWEENNKIKFNGTKFQVLGYGSNQDIKDETCYCTSNMEDIIQRVTSLRDLGVILSEDGKFDNHIQKVFSKVRQKFGWMLRTFYTRRSDILKQLWKTLAQCHIEYCSQLYMPRQSQGMQAIEKLFYDVS